MPRPAPATDPLAGEYAECYGLRERLRFLFVALLFNGALYLFWTRWALPRWRGFAEWAPCYSWGPLQGTDVLCYSLFVGLPLLAALTIGIFTCPRGLRILRQGQVPYRGEKTFRPTRIRRGRVATLAGWAHLLAALPLVLVAAWGMFQAQAMSAGFDDQHFDYAQCPLGTRT